MIYTLHLCVGIWLGMCGQIREFDYPSEKDCIAARESFPKQKLGDGYAVCMPKSLNDKQKWK